MSDVDVRAGESEAWGEADVIDRLRELFAIALNIRVPADDTDLLGSGLLDSLGLVELLFHVEQTFGLTIELDELDVENFRSLRTIAAIVAARRRATSGQLPRWPAEPAPSSTARRLVVTAGPASSHASTSERDSHGAAGVSGIRVLRRDDAPAVAALYERVMRSGSATPPPRLAPYFVRTFLEQPWGDEAVPSLVYVDEDDRIVGCIGAMEHRLRFDDRPIRMVASGPLISEPEARPGAVGALLLRRLMMGPQDVTITDAASDTVRRIWERFGGETLHLSSIRWTRLFRPAQCVAEHFLERAQRNGARRVLRPLGAIARPVLRAADSAVTRIPRNPFATRTPDSIDEPLTPRAMLEELPVIARSLRLRPDYDERFLEWLFRELRDVRSRGKLDAVLVRGRDGRVLGWFVCFIRPTGLGTVLQVVARDDGAGTVIDHLFHYARTAGARGLIGRLEPRLVAPLASRGCTLFNTGKMFALIYSRIPGLVDVVRSGQALLTWMDGESGFGHWSEAFT